MNKKIKIFKCDKCGNIIIKLNDCGNDDFFCCNQLMEFLEPNRTEIGSEKHIPFIAKKTTNKNTTNISVRIGEIEHPFSNSHYIE
jgi:superoxide reductase